MMARKGTRALRLSDGPGHDAASVESVRAGLAERLQTRRSQIAEAVFARFREAGFDPEQGEDAEYVAGSRAAILEAVDYGLGAIERGEEWFGSIPPAAVAQVRRAARDGVKLEKVLLRNSAGHTVLEDFVVQEVDFASQSIVLRSVFATLGALLDHFTAVLAHEYQREVERMAHTPELRRTEQVQRLIAGGPVEAAGLDYELDAEHLGVVAVGAKARETVRALGLAIGRELLSVSPGAGTVWAWFGGRGALDIADLGRLVSSGPYAGVSLAVGESGRGIDGWRLTHRQAQAAMLVALRQPQRLTRYADVSLLAAVLKDHELARSLVEVHLSPLEGRKDSAVAHETLRAYFAAGCNAATAAAALGVDRHTVERRVRAIETKLGRLLHTRRAELEVALRLQELDDLTGPSDGGRLRSR
jgi:hypothetical protein